MQNVAEFFFNSAVHYDNSNECPLGLL